MLIYLSKNAMIKYHRLRSLIHLLSHRKKKRLKDVAGLMSPEFSFCGLQVEVSCVSLSKSHHFMRSQQPDGVRNQLYSFR